ncbi:MAG: prolyl oligopeptidase family serine peptidase, partial [Ilumatobacteraceae bacterium]
LRGDNTDGGRVLVSGSDFVSSPALSADGTTMAWVTWEHPSMPWDATALWSSPLDAAGLPYAPGRVAGGPAESAVRPQFRGDELHLITDRTGWWNLARVAPDGALHALAPSAHDFADPQWVFGLSDYAFVGADRILVRWYDGGIAELGLIDAAGTLTPIDIGAVAIDHLQTAVSGSSAVVVAGFADRATAVLRINVDNGDVETLRSSTDMRFPAEGVSLAESVEWTSTDGTTSYGFFYGPRNARFAGPADELPPLMVMSHGGPTSATSSSLSPRLQYWTSRGFAVLDVNYGGSTGYGRAYRDRLQGRWGIVDVDDCTTGAQFLAARGSVDPARLAIRGGSAGGYTTLAALAFRDVFAAGASHYGIGDLGALARDTHKFESRYLDGLVGPYPRDEAVYIERSPLFHADQIDSALILLQGRDDLVVPPDQAQSMADAVRANGQPVALLMFDGEGHGFRQAPNIIRAIEAELWFYGRVFGFTPAGDIEPVEIDNL